MKLRLLSFALLFVLGLPLYGQLQPKTMFAGGSALATSDFDNYATYNTDVEAGILTDDAFALGARLLRSQFYFDSEFIPDQSIWGGTLFARYYLPGESPTAFFVTLEGSFELLNIYREDIIGTDNNNESFSTIGARVGVGVDQFLAPTAALETVAGFFWSQTEDRDAVWGLSADLGLRLFLPTGQEKNKASLVSGMSMLGISGSFTGELSDDNSYSLFLNPEYGYLVTPFFMIGAEAQYFTASGAGNTVALRPLLRFYLNPQSRFKVFLTGVGGFQYQSNDSISKTLWQLRAGPGVNHFVTPNLALEAFLGYRSHDLSSEVADELILNLGIRAFLGNKGTSPTTLD